MSDEIELTKSDGSTMDPYEFSNAVQEDLVEIMNLVQKLHLLCRKKNVFLFSVLRIKNKTVSGLSITSQTEDLVLKKDEQLTFIAAIIACVQKRFGMKLPFKDDE